MRTGAAQELQQQRLGLVVGMVRDRDDVGIGRGERGVARGTRRRLEALAGRPRDPRPVHRQRDRPARALGGAELGPGVGIRREAVVDVQGGHGDRQLARERGQRVEQHHRIAAARQRDGDGEAPGYGIAPKRQQRSERGANGRADRIGRFVRSLRRGHVRGGVAGRRRRTLSRC